MQVIDIHYLTGVNIHENTAHMHDLKTNFDKILSIVNITLSRSYPIFLGKSDS